MVVAVLAVRVVEMIADEIVDVIAVRNLLMPAIRPVLVRGPVPAAVVLRRTRLGIFAIDLENVLVDVVAMRMVQMPVMQIIDVTVVLNRGMTAARTMLMGVIGMDVVLRIAHARHDKHDRSRRQANGDEKHPHLSTQPTRQSGSG